MLRLGKERGAVSVVNDQIGMVTYTYDLARLVVDMIQTKEYGTYHATNSGDFISWYDFAKEKAYLLCQETTSAFRNDLHGR